MAEDYSADLTSYRWGRKYGGMASEMAKELKTLEKENIRLKKLVADQALDNAILKEAAQETSALRATSPSGS